MTDVLIIGAGIAGMAAALGLSKAGIDVTVYEAHPDSGADIGAFLTLADNGMRALAQLDAAELVAGAGFPLTGMAVVDHTGAQIGTVPLGGHGHPLTNYRCLRRAELGALLRSEARRRGVRIRHGHRFASLVDDTVRFADGHSVRARVVIGADGLNSAVRSGVSSAVPRFAGQHVWYGYTTAARPPSVAGRITMVRGSGSAFGYCVSPTGETFWFARVSAPGPLSTDEIDRTSAAHWRESLVGVLGQDAAPAADIVAATEQIMVTNAWDLPPGTRWRLGSRRRVDGTGASSVGSSSMDAAFAGAVLIGDAAHAASPATGQGASMALEDGVVLAKALRDNDDHDALELYERVRRARVDRNIEASAAATAGRSTGTPQRGTQSHVDPELAALLDWRTPLRH